jgi:Transposase DDE domain group 1
VKSSHTFAVESAVFDETNLVSSAGLVPIMELADRTGLSTLINEQVTVDSARVASGAVNPAGKLTSIIAAMMAGADHIDHAELLRSGGTATVFGETYAPSTLGIFLREFTFGHAQQVAAVARCHLVALALATPLLEGADERVYVDIDSVLRPVYGHGKQGGSFGHAKIAGRSLLRRGLCPLLTTLSTAKSAPVVAEIRLRSGKTGSGKGAASQVTTAIGTAREAGATGKILLRGDSAFGNRKVMRAAIKQKAEFSLSIARNRAIDKAIAAIPEDAWVGVKYPGAVQDPDTGAWISDAEVAETTHTIGSGRATITVRLIVRRVRDANHLDALFRVWRYHPFVTNSDLPTIEADLIHRQHAIIETVISDLIDGPLAHLPSGLFAANTVWTLCAQIAHNLLRAAGTLAGGKHAVARGATLRRDLVNVPARFARPARRPVLHLPAHWPWEHAWNRLWRNIFGHTPLNPEPA